MKHRIDWRQVAGTALMAGLLALGAAACGDDGDDNTPIAGTTAAGVGGGGGGMGGGAAGAGAGGGGMGGGGGGTSGGGGGMGGAMSVMCMPASGPVTCDPVPSAAAPGGALPACCDAMEGNRCGAITSATTMECIATGQMGMPDPSCPPENNILGMATPGCCRPDGMCGLQSGTLMGCVERSRYPVGFLAMVGGMAPPPLQSMACGGDADGGI